MIVKKLRLQRGWSQEHLSQCSGLSVRTIQRIERGQKAGLESLKSLAAVFDVDIDTLKQEKETVQHKDIDEVKVTDDEKRAMEYVQGLKEFYSHLAVFVIVMTGLIILNLYITPDYYWFWFALLGWGVGLATHAVTTFDVFNLFGADWEKKQIEKRLGRDL